MSRVKKTSSENEKFEMHLEEANFLNSYFTNSPPGRSESFETLIGKLISVLQNDQQKGTVIICNTQP